MVARLARPWVFAAMCVLGPVPARAAFGYDPFPDSASIQPADELEERLWDEAELLRAQFVRGKPSPAVDSMQRLVRGVLLSHWPELSGKVKVFVIEQADVLALSSANGDIILSTGMLVRLDSEEELQVILAREIAHFTHRHSVRTVYTARVGAGAKVIASTALDAADIASKITTGVGMLDLARSVASMSQEVLLTSGRELVQDKLNKLKEILADSFFRSISVTGIGLVVKSSIFGFRNTLEQESDIYAMTFIERQQGSTDAYRRVMQRLYDEAVLDEKKFSVFYANEDRLSDRLKALAEFESQRSERAMTAVAAPENPVSSELHGRGAQTEATAYSEAIVPLVMPVLESELEAARYRRLMHNIERPRSVIRLPDRAQAVLAESCVSVRDQALQDKGLALAQTLLAQQPEDARMWTLLGQLAYRKEQWTVAREHFSKALQYAPEGNDRGFIQQSLRQIDKKLSEASK
jgi:hypothetical protein